MTYVLILFVLVVMPIVSHLELKRLRSHSTDKLKELAYWKIYALYTIVTALILTQTPFGRLYLNQHTFHLHWFLNAVLWLLTTYQAFILIAPMVIIRFNKELLQKTAESYAKKSHVFPSTNRHLIMFVFVALIVGISEELIFRGFMFNFANDLGIPAVWSFLIVSIIFGLGHFDQGKEAILESTLFGISMGFLCNVTGSLLIPIIWHIMVDAKVVYITRFLQTRKKPIQ